MEYLKSHLNNAISDRRPTITTLNLYGSNFIIESLALQYTAWGSLSLSRIEPYSVIDPMRKQFSLNDTVPFSRIDQNRVYQNDGCHIREWLTTP